MWADNTKAFDDQGAAIASRCWVVTDGRAGIENQALGLARAVAQATPMEVVVKRVRLGAPWRYLPAIAAPRLPALLNVQGDPLTPGADEDWPTLWIGCGRQSAPLANVARNVAKTKGRRIFTVQIQNPRMPARLFDLVVPPRHDGLVGDNVFPIVGSPNLIGTEAIAPSKGLIDRAARLPSPVAAVLIGGKNALYDYGAKNIGEIVAAIRSLIDRGVGLIITTSRRTPPRAASAIAGAVKGEAAILHNPLEDDPADNPYPGLLAFADVAIVTPDSVNMAAEAATAGTPALMLSLSRKPLARLRRSKFDDFHDALRSIDALRDFSGRIEVWTPSPFDETARAAKEIIRRMGVAAD